MEGYNNFGMFKVTFFSYKHVLMENKVRIIRSSYHLGILFECHTLAWAGIPYFL